MNEKMSEKVEKEKIIGDVEKYINERVEEVREDVIKELLAQAGNRTNVMIKTYDKEDAIVLLAGAIIDLKTVGLYNGIYPDAEDRIEQALKVVKIHNYERKRALDLRANKYGSSKKR